MTELTIDFETQFWAECQPDPLWSDEEGLYLASRPVEDEWWKEDLSPLHNELDFMFESRPRREWDGKISARQEWGRKIKKRDGHICQMCGGFGSVAHHIVPVNQDPDLALDMSNGQTLCDRCHLEVHRDRQRAAGGSGSPWLY